MAHPVGERASPAMGISDSSSPVAVGAGASCDGFARTVRRVPTWSTGPSTLAAEVEHLHGACLSSLFVGVGSIDAD